MKFLALFAALLLEQVRPLRRENPVFAAFARYAAFLESQLDAGLYYHGVLAWMLAVLPVAIVTALMHHVFDAVSPILAWAWSLIVLYLTMGFRQFSHYFREIARALRDGDVVTAREYLGRWRGKSAAELTAPELARVAIELALVGSHRHVFGPFAGFIVFGPAGAVVYSLSAMLAELWGNGATVTPPAQAQAEPGEFGLFARRFFFWYDWAPTRITAASCAVVGNFEDAIYCWRTQAPSWTAGAKSILLASGGGALGVRLGDPLEQGGIVEYRPELGTGDEADVDYMQSAIGLIWRVLVLWMFLVFVVTVAHSLG